MKTNKIVTATLLFSSVATGYTAAYVDAANVEQESTASAYMPGFSEANTPAQVSATRTALSTPTFEDEATLASYLTQQLHSLENSITVRYTGDKKNLLAFMRTTIEADDYLLGVVAKFGYSSRGNNVTFNITYHTTGEQQQFIDTEVARIVSAIIHPSMSDSEKVRAINDYIVLNTTYTTQAITSPHSAYTLFKEGKGVCQAYALAAYQMFKKAGLEAHYVTGISNIEHAWNLVKIDGEWYHIDVTYNDPVFEVFDETTRNFIQYKYFLMTDAQISKDHTMHETARALPKATSERFTAFHSVSAPVQVRDELYFVNQADDFTLYKLSLHASTPVAVKVSSTRVQQPFYANGALYFSNYSSGGHLTKYDVKTGAETIVQRTKVSHIVREGNDLVAYNGLTVVHREAITDDGKPVLPAIEFDYLDVMEQIAALNHLTIEYIEEVRELLAFVEQLPTEQQGYISNLDELLEHVKTAERYGEIADEIEAAIEQLDTEADFKELIAKTLEVRQEVLEVMPTIFTNVKNLEKLNAIESYIVEQTESLVDNIDTLHKDFAQNAAQLVQIVEVLGEDLEVILPEELVQQIATIQEKYEKMQSLTFDNSSAWAKPETTKDAKKTWTVKLNQSPANNAANKSKIKVVDMFGDSVVVDVAISGSQITVKPKQAYVDGVPYTLVIEAGLESSRGKKLSKGIHLQFTFEK